MPTPAFFERKIVLSICFVDEKISNDLPNFAMQYSDIAQTLGKLMYVLTNIYDNFGKFWETIAN